MLKEAIQEVRVFAPATVANVACGYDVLGFAIDAPGDEVVVRFCEKPGLHITTITGDDGNDFDDGSSRMKRLRVVSTFEYELK